MGETKQHTTFRLSEETLCELNFIQTALAPFAEDRSSTLRIVIKLMHALLFTPATIRDVSEVLQRLHRGTLSHDQFTLRFPQQGMAMRPRTREASDENWR